MVTPFVANPDLSIPAVLHSRPTTSRARPERRGLRSAGGAGEVDGERDRPLVVERGALVPRGVELPTQVASGDRDGGFETARIGAEGTFSTTYTFESRWDPAETTGGSEIWGRCQHLIVRGSGTGGLHDVTGLIGRPTS